MITQTDLGLQVEGFADIEAIVSAMQVGETKSVIIPSKPDMAPDTDRLALDLADSLARDQGLTITALDQQNMPGYVEITKTYNPSP